MTSIQYFGRDVDGVCRGGVAVGRAPAEIAEELFRFGWQIATLLRDHHQVVGWVRLEPNGSEATWYAEKLTDPLPPQPADAVGRPAHLAGIPHSRHPRR